ncbi:MAG TPA: N(4)-(beta-N-acetylglucosaminyl)-L-asparaginase [Gemmatimonadales bacterium]|nr:N(4)-(beta-N-acetylglucosaminyl)-L-asparaginase [Gemmatimonadales bacterium]
MSQPVSRRTFLGASGLSAAAVAWPALSSAVVHRSSRRAAAVSSSNGLRAVNRAMELVLGGSDTLDAAVEGVKIQELDPADDSVGYGGLPNEDGVVQLDASCMHGPSKRAGGVAALEGIKTPSAVALLVLKYTDHVLLVGEGAKRFALSYGFQEEELLTAASRQRWLEWRANRSAEDDWLDVPENESMVTGRPTGTINLNVVNAKGELSSVTTTSGLAWKIPGRVGDSPLVGAGQYTDNDIGAAGSTGRGEANIMACGGFLTVEGMRRGLKPTDACLETLKRVVRLTPARLLRDGRPTFNLTFYAVNKAGDFGAASLYPSRYAAHDGKEGALRDTAHLFPRRA